MKKYSEYVNFLSESADLVIPDDAILKTLYPDLEYPGQRQQQWYQDERAKRMRAETEVESSGSDIPGLRKEEVNVLNSKITHMITRASVTGNDEFIEEVMALIEGYPELLVGLKLGNEIITTDSNIKVVGDSRDIIK